jgi:hypothetical protein
MFNLGHIPTGRDVEVFEYYYDPSTSQNFGWYALSLPVNKTMVSMYCMGGGGGGGLAYSGATAGGGGGGGGGAGSSSLLVPRILLPDTVFIKVGAGGVTLSTGPGSNTTVSWIPNPTTARDSFCLGIGGSVGGSGTFSAGGAGGVGGSVSNPLSHAALASVGIYSSWAGADGGAGNTVASGAASYVTLQSCNGGTGGGGANVTTFSAGGAIAAQSVYPIVSATTSKAQFGTDGYTLRKPFYSVGGTGGAGSHDTAGGNGGKGGIGSGGGGSGYSPTVSSALPGDGGSGYALIMCY